MVALSGGGSVDSHSVFIMLSYLLLSLAAGTTVSAFAHPVYSQVIKRAGNAVASIGRDFPDPSIIEVDNAWYSFATNGSGVNIQFSSTTNFQGSWTLKSGYDALPILPSWADVAAPDVWAPDVVQVVHTCDTNVFFLNINIPCRTLAHSSCTSPLDQQ